MSIILTLKLTEAHQCVFLFLQRCGYSDSQTLIKSLNSLQAQLGILGLTVWVLFVSRRGSPEAAQHYGQLWSSTFSLEQGRASKLCTHLALTISIDYLLVQPIFKRRDYYIGTIAACSIAVSNFSFVLCSTLQTYHFPLMQPSSERELQVPPCCSQNIHFLQRKWQLNFCV